jgi:hypothetical protein
MRYWASLYFEETQVVIRSGVETMMRAAFKTFDGQAKSAVPLRITDGSDAVQATSGEDEDPHETEEGSDDPTILRDP